MKHKNSAPQQRSTTTTNEERLTNFLLRLPKAHRWAVYEFFYSDIDYALLEGESEFKICLRETFPLLRNKTITRCEWNMIRRLLGKPRRCSPAFFAEGDSNKLNEKLNNPIERESLEARRQKVRTLQRGGSIPSDQLHDLPNSIPALLPVGTRVTCRIGSQSGANGGAQQQQHRPSGDNVLCQGVVEVVVKVL